MRRSQMPRFRIPETLLQQRFFGFDGFEKLREFCSRHFKLLGVPLPDSPQFLAGEHDFFFRPAVKNHVVLRVAFGPLPVHECVSGSSIKRVVPHGNIPFLQFRITKEIGPVIEVVNLDTFAWNHFRCTLFAVIRNLAMCAVASLFQAGLVRLTRTLPERGVTQRVIDFVGVLRQFPVKLVKRPYGVALWIDRLSYLARPHHQLRVSFKVVNELGIRGSEKSFTNRPETSFGRRPRLLHDLISRQQRFKVGALEFTPTIDDHNLRKP